MAFMFILIENMFSLSTRSNLTVFLEIEFQKIFFLLLLKGQMPIILLGLRQVKTCLRACAKCADSHHSAHAQSIIRAFALH